MNLTHDQLIEIAYTAAAYFAVGAFSITLYSLFQRKNDKSSANRTQNATNEINRTQTASGNVPPMSFVKFSDMAPSAAPNRMAAKPTATRPVTENEREAVLKIVRERLREVSPAERLADAMSRK
jgi:hypothetical protein